MATRLRFFSSQSSYKCSMTTIIIFTDSRTNFPVSVMLGKILEHLGKRLATSLLLFYIKNLWAIPASFPFIFVFSTVSSKYVHYKILPMTGFKIQTFGFGSNNSANWATTGSS